MGAVENIAFGLSALADPLALALLLAAIVGGVVIGALPGLGPIMMISLLLPFTLGMEPTLAISLTAAIYCAAIYGGSISAILINTPGTPAAAATTFDGFPLAERGEAGRALGIATWSSTVGGVLSVVAMILLAPLLARLAYQFGPPEYFGLTVFSLSMLATIGSGSTIRSLIGGAFGVLLATVGMEFTTGVERFTFGVPELTDGVNFVPVMIGVFAGSEFLIQASRFDVRPTFIGRTAAKLPSLADIRRIWRTVLQSSGIGIFIGILPAEGGTIASMIAYNEARRWSRKPEEFGTGAPEGIAAPEAANNASTGGAMIPTLALGIPGSGVTAVILAGMMMHGVRPGPFLFTEQPAFLHAIFATMLVTNVAFMGLGLLGAKAFAYVTLVPRALLWPAVVVLAVIGAYSIQQSFVDVWIMFAFSVVGYVMRRHGFAPAPVVMGLVLGALVETSLKQSLLMFDHDWLRFLQSPMVVLFLALTVLSLSWSAISARGRARRRIMTGRE